MAGLSVATSHATFQGLYGECTTLKSVLEITAHEVIQNNLPTTRLCQFGDLPSASMAHAPGPGKVPPSESGVLFQESLSMQRVAGSSGDRLARLQSKFANSVAIRRYFAGIQADALLKPIFEGKTMKKPGICLTLLLATTVSAPVGSGVAVAQDVGVDEHAADTIEQIVATGKAARIEDKSVTVRYADLDPEDQQGAEFLYRRLHHAAETVCNVGDARKARCLEDLRQAEQCYRQAIHAAVESIDSELLTSIHFDREHGEMLAETVE